MNNPTLIIAIAGGSGAGKTWLAEGLCRAIGEKTSLLSMDDFYLDRAALAPARRARLNFDHPRALDWACFEAVLRDCKAGRTTIRPRYDFASHTRQCENETWQPRSVVIVEGLWPLRKPTIRRMFDWSIFLDAPADLRLERRLKRDAGERGRNAACVRRYFAEVVEPMHRRFLQPQAGRADTILNVPFTVAGISGLGQQLWRLLASRFLVPDWRRETFQADLRGLAHHPEDSYAEHSIT